MLDSFIMFLSRGLTDLSGFQLFIYTLISVQLTIMSVTLYLHRSMAHRGVDFHPVLSHFFRFWLWLTTGMRTIDWVSIHRKHHASCETVDDPHSPKIVGIKKVLLEGAELYRQSANDETRQRYGHGCPNDWMEKHIYSHKRLGLFALLFVEWALFGGFGIAIWAIQMAWIPFWAAGMINGTAHYIGYRNYESPDWSTNLIPIAFWIGGEELHNNHHAFPSSAKFSTKWWEFDIGWMYIKIFSTLGLAKVKRVAPRVIIDKDKEGLDIDTIKSIIINRVHVMSNYAKDVVMPSVKSISFREKIDLKRIKKLLVKEQSMMDAKSEKDLNEVLKDHPSLKEVYNYRIQLQQIWERAASSQENLLQALKDWCKQAEESGIKVLQEFAQSLKTYVLPPSQQTA